MNCEIWKCTTCGSEAPCIVKIFYEEGKYGPLKNENRFRRKICICENSPSPEWVRSPDQEFIEKY